MRSTAPCTARANCTDDTDNRTDSIRCAGIIRRAIPRTIQRRRRPYPVILLLGVTSPRAPRLCPRERALPTVFKSVCDSLSAAARSRRLAVFLLKKSCCNRDKSQRDAEIMGILPLPVPESANGGEPDNNVAYRADLRPIDIHSARLSDRPNVPGDRRLRRRVLRRGLVSCHVFRLPSWQRLAAVILVPEPIGLRRGPGWVETLAVPDGEPGRSAREGDGGLPQEYLGDVPAGPANKRRPQSVTTVVAQRAGAHRVKPSPTCAKCALIR